MKTIYLTLVLACCAFAYANGQSIHPSPERLDFTNPGPELTDTISATGLVPATGFIVVSAPAKFVIIEGGVVNYGDDTIAYSGGTVPPTAVTFAFAFSGSSSGTVTITGGGASSYICVSGNDPSYYCIPAAVTNVAEETSLSVLPNPAEDELSVSAAKNITELTICNLIGNIEYAQKCNSQNVKVSIANLPQGIHLLRINNDTVRKFVKQ